MNKNNKRNRKYYYLKKDGGNMFFRTDLAVERREIFKRANKINSEIDGIKIETKIFLSYTIVSNPASFIAFK